MVQASSAQTFNFELVSPERRLIAEPATKVIVPGEEGVFGVLPNHSSLLATVKPGVVEIYTDGAAEPRRVFIAGGFADVTATNCTILAEEAVNVNDLKQSDIEQSIANLKEDLARATDAVEKARIEKRITLARAKLEAVTGHIILS